MNADNDPLAGLDQMATIIAPHRNRDGQPISEPDTKAPIERRHISLIMWLQNIKRIDYGARLLEVVDRGGILTIPSGTKEIDTYSRHVVSLKGDLGPCSMFYDGSTLIKMTIALHGFAIIGGLQPSQAHKITGTHLRGYQLDVLEIRLGMTWGEVGE